MNGERWALRIGECLVRGACRRLPAKVRERRYQEWMAELPVILQDPGVSPAARRVARMLGFAADTLRGAILTPGSGRRRKAGRSARELAVLVPGAAVLGCLVYLMSSGPGLVYYGAFSLFWLAALIRGLARRGRGAWTAFRWSSAGILAFYLGQLTDAVADRLGWGHPQLFTLIEYCGAAICIACWGAAVIVWRGSIREPRHPSIS